MRVKEPQVARAVAAPVVGTLRARGTAFARRVAVSLAAAAVPTGFAAALTPFGMTLPWLTGVFALVLVSTFTIGTARDRRSFAQLWVVTAPDRRLVLGGPGGTAEFDLNHVVAVQVWCDCGGRAKSVAPHRDELEVLLRDGRAVTLSSATVFPPDVAMTLSELLAPAGVKVVDWGEADAS